MRGNQREFFLISQSMMASGSGWADGAGTGSWSVRVQGLGGGVLTKGQGQVFQVPVLYGPLAGGRVRTPGHDCGLVNNEDLFDEPIHIGGPVGAGSCLSRRCRHYLPGFQGRVGGGAAVRRARPETLPVWRRPRAGPLGLTMPRGAGTVAAGTMNGPFLAVQGMGGGGWAGFSAAEQ